MTLKESYEYMFHKLTRYYETTHNNELGGMLGGFDTSLNGKPFDRAAWHDWLKAVKKVTLNEEVTQDEAFKATLFLLKEYNDHHGFELSEVIAHFEKQIKSSN